MKAAVIKRMASKALDELAMALDDGHSESLKAYLAMLGKFHRYSPGNVLLIHLQCPGATHVAGYRTWQRLGRQVKQGEKAIRILAPVVYRETEDDDETERKLVAFKAACVFDVAQTEGEALPEFAKVQGDCCEQLDRLKQWIREQGITLTYTNRIGPAQGASAGGTVFLREDLEPAEEFSALVHEVAHERLHQDKVERSKTVCETEAEAVAFVVNQAVGLDCSTASSDYVQLYDGTKETLMESLERIQQAAREIIQAVVSEPEERTRHEPQQEALAAA